MSTVPVHPALVHVPLGLAFVIPLVVLGLAWALWSGLLPRRAWSVAVVLQALLLGGALVALRTGEADEDRVERIVGEAALERHELAAKQFVFAAGAALVLGFAPLLLRGRALGAAVVATALASAAVAGLAIRVGHAGGQLVYVHGAASAYAGAPPGVLEKERSDD
jgi:uncharacterized membrane protein